MPEKAHFFNKHNFEMIDKNDRRGRFHLLESLVVVVEGVVLTPVCGSCVCHSWAWRPTHPPSCWASMRWWSSSTTTCSCSAQSCSKRSTVSSRNSCSWSVLHCALLTVSVLAYHHWLPVWLFWLASKIVWGDAVMSVCVSVQLWGCHGQNY